MQKDLSEGVQLNSDNVFLVDEERITTKSWSLLARQRTDGPIMTQH